MTSGWRFQVRNREKGSLIIVSLLLILILLIMGMCFIGVKALQYRGSTQLRDISLIDSIAEAGMEDAKIKLEKDLEFPPPGDDDQKIFAYTENFHDIDESTILGTYTVTIDSNMKDAPYYIIRVSSIGIAGPLESPYAKKLINAELDVSPMRRDMPSNPNPNYFQFINWQETGGL